MIDELYHHGILKQRWGVRHGPPYPLRGGAYSPSQKKAIYKQRNNRNSIYNNKHFDEVLSKDKTVLTTLSRDKNRTVDTDLFFATHDKWDKAQYNALFNQKAPEAIYDENGNQIGTKNLLKWRIDNKLTKDMKVASEDSAAKVFKKLYTENRDFYNFVTDEERMRAYFVDSRYKFRGYRQSRKVLQKLDQLQNKTLTEKDVDTLYRMFNYVIPNDGGGNQRIAKDVLTNRTRFFNELKKEGYSAVLDTNDAIYGGFKAKSPIIVFDMEAVVPDRVFRTNMASKEVAKVATAFRKAAGF